LSVENIIAIGIFGLFSIRIEPLTLTSTGMHIPDVGFLHWSVFIGPAEMVRQGGWLLWDVPSQYGFLEYTLIVHFPCQKYLAGPIYHRLSAIFVCFYHSFLIPSVLATRYNKLCFRFVG
jgi:hypothetical protein